MKNLNKELYFVFGETTILAFCSKFRNFSLKNHFEINLTKNTYPTNFAFKILTSKFLIFLIVLLDLLQALIIKVSIFGEINPAFVFDTNLNFFHDMIEQDRNL